jgi:DNA-dependent RNA polymerase auxiliary subunit epsilon
MKLTWAKIKLWCFHNWRFLVIGGAILLAYLLGGKKVKALQTQLRMARDLYKKEIDAIEGASDKKAELQSSANLKYQRALEIAHRTAMDSNDYAELQKAERVRQLVEENKENPEVIDRILADEFGILVMDLGDKK